MLVRPWPLFKCVCLPLPALGLQPATHASTNLRNRPTVTSYLSKRKSLIVAGAVVSVPRLNVPPVTRRLRAHTSLLLTPQSLRPAPVNAAVVAVSSPVPATEHEVAPWLELVPAPHAVQITAFVVFE